MNTTTATKPRKAPYEARCAALERELILARREAQQAIETAAELRGEVRALNELTPYEMAQRIRELEEEAEAADTEHAEELEAATLGQYALVEAARAVLAAVKIGQIKAMATYEVEINDLRKAVEDVGGVE